MNYFKFSHANRSQQTGIALVVVLWVLALLSIIALAYSGMTRNENVLTRNILHTAQARAEAEAGFWLAAYDLLKPANTRLLTPDGSPMNIPVEPRRRLTVAIQDESGKIDINKASQQLLIGLFSAAGVEYDQSTQLVDALLDWRDKDNLQRINGAEDSDYSAAGLPYGAKDGTFNSIEELIQLRGITPEIFKKLKPAITIHSMQARIRLHSAPISVLNSLPGMTEELITEIMASRLERGNVIIPALIPDSVRPLVFTSGQGNVYTITSDAQVEGMNSRLQVTLILKKSGNRPITILDWQENAPPLRQKQIVDPMIDNNDDASEL